MKRNIRCICMVLAFVIVCAIPAFAAENIEPKASNYFGASSVYLCNVTSNSFEAWFDVTAVNRMDQLGATYIKIQRSTDGVNWTTVRTCAKENYLALIGYNTSYHASGIYHGATGGYYYRAHVQLYAKKGVNTATMNEYSAPIYIPAS